MGCGTSRSLPPSDFDGRGARTKLASTKPPRIDVGRAVGGEAVDPNKRAAQLAAAEKRAAQEANRGLSRHSSKGAELSESARKQELVGRIQAVYHSLNKEVPLGLNLASVEQLRNHLDAIRKTSSLV